MTVTVISASVHALEHSETDRVRYYCHGCCHGGIATQVVSPAGTMPALGGRRLRKLRRESPGRSWVVGVVTPFQGGGDEVGDPVAFIEGCLSVPVHTCSVRTYVL